ncbi:hypothetical protein FITA111629_05675 [Filibacter tadaridae]|uniref:ATP-binding protein n=1 Tax=Filibacter tadaridae TaxID=2483811 RepID=A0A3P5WIZ2_9BACL|nr:hypothetical protein [Filibacter tadaridae]VDC19389.1 hypothetical protein FILTAD_00326 [Filibacter tadaridae]
MRNAIDIGGDFIVTTDNSGGIGEKAADIVRVPDRVTAYFAARVALLEQWAANAQPITILIHNFSGSESWEEYKAGVKDLFHEAGIPTPSISGSTETNMQLLQSAMAVTMIGKRTAAPALGKSKWFTYGTPLVGNEVQNRTGEIASVSTLRKAIQHGIVQQIWPVGSRGILEEVRTITGNHKSQIETILDTTKSAGPSTVVLLAIAKTQIEQAIKHFGTLLNELQIHQ